MNKETAFNIFLIIITIIVLVIVIPDSLKNDDFCRENGFYRSKDVGGMEPGYIYCCKDVYVDHFKAKECKAINIEEKNE